MYDLCKPNAMEADCYHSRLAINNGAVSLSFYEYFGCAVVHDSTKNPSQSIITVTI